MHHLQQQAEFTLQPQRSSPSVTYTLPHTSLKSQEASVSIPSSNRPVKCKLNYAAAAVKKCLSPPSATAALVPAVTCWSDAAPLSSPNVSSTTVLKMKAEPKDLLDRCSVTHRTTTSVPPAAVQPVPTTSSYQVQV